MIELPEAITLARQITQTLKGQRIESAVRGNSPHKFTWYNRSPEEYAAILPGKQIGGAWASGGCVMVAVEPGYVLELGGGGERMRYHADDATLPKKHQLLLSFCDRTHLTVTVQMWGSAQLRDEGEAYEACTPEARRVSPVGDDYTYAHFSSLLDAVPEDDKRSVKLVCISQPGVWGLGNGYTHDILFKAGLDPRRRILQTTGPERRKLYDAIRSTLSRAIGLDGRDTELDLFGQPGRYVPILDRRAKGRPCTVCGATIEAIAFLGGTSYFCPSCQR